LAIFWSRIVLPGARRADDQATLAEAMGTIMSTTRISIPSAPLSMTIRLSGWTGFRSSKKICARAGSGRRR